MDLYVNTSQSEGMSQSIVEAMAAGLPVVATDVGDSRLLIDGEPACGFVVPPGNVAALAGALAELSVHPEQCGRFAVESRRRHTERYGISPMVSACEQMYEYLIGAQSSAGLTRREPASA